MPKSKKKRTRDDVSPDEKPLSRNSSSENEEESMEYYTFGAPNYKRKYDLNSNISEYVVFLSYTDQQASITDKTRMTISQGLKKTKTKGIQHLRSINKYKVGVVFDAANSANVFIDNIKFFEETEMVPSLSAAATEVTGVVRDVLVTFSNKKIFSAINSSKNVVQDKKFTRKEKADNVSIVFKPTKTIAITFASTQLPQHVYLDNWRHEVATYIPLVKQCLKCLRYGYIAKFCKNSEKCSICSEGHSFKVCIVD
ncbi:uncharacterized protein LOC113237995 [Hyposmocoma kahamanoa]|uniref:uncharacterized protein LOC113237995 n=1 Tax=Hyposmocoma kahamanoa TaxID=1477025 RepID=UPI000E6D5F27|nr:uncharacterized protein LOC113237995 [Hyposmocoma kahamanoa]